ncbi:NADH-dependent flavin oxidoreductase [Camelimonas fluminis]|uniref:NADH:flavin oxidoreductase n=1 Tax=Camelimonas fluminis TaxID=1576911 RepID=A0ABV7UHW7_9HYPH|nr:NADH:flavin oxidoreductase [Camelimonas fluminis]GHE75114.1 NADH-dependent flavin oxidoreductase [Camelimonas fluminis]
MTGANGTQSASTRNLGEPLPLPRGKAMKNRFMLAPLTNMQSNPDGTLHEDEYKWLVRRAEGGFGLTMTCAAHVQRTGQGFNGQLGVWSDDQLPGLTRLAGGIRAAGSLSSVQLQHSGQRSSRELTGVAPVAPVAMAETGARALTTDEVKQLRDDFIAAAVRSEKAGFDGVELHGAHGYLLCHFLDAGNTRDDAYGGSLENRARLLNEIIDGVRAETRADFQLGVRLSPERYGVVLDEARALATELMTSGKIDYLDMSLWSVFKQPEDPAHHGKRLIDCFTDLPRGNTPLGVAGKIMDAATAQACLDAGADFVLIGRGAIIHHDFPRRALADPAFSSLPLPVSRDHLAAEALGPKFIDYMATGWKNFVADAA